MKNIVKGIIAVVVILIIVFGIGITIIMGIFLYKNVKEKSKVGLTRCNAFAKIKSA